MGAIEFVTHSSISKQDIGPPHPAVVEPVLPPPYLTVCLGYKGRVSGELGLSTHRAMQQLANKDEFCCAWQRCFVHYFPLCPARIPDLSSCLSCKDTLSGPDSSSHAHAQYAWLIHTSLALTPPILSPTYVGNICSDLSH